MKLTWKGPTTDTMQQHLQPPVTQARTWSLPWVLAVTLWCFTVFNKFDSDCKTQTSFATSSGGVSSGGMCEQSQGKRAIQWWWTRVSSRRRLDWAPDPGFTCC